jgi:hypothetical protein
MRVLALGTYPIRRPVHGGQRRTFQIGRHYLQHGAEYRHACVYDSRHYGPDDVSEADFPYASPGKFYVETPFIDDLGSGDFATRDEDAYRHFRILIETFEPDVIQVEQPFMWPLVRRLREEGVLAHTRLVYSSHNFEPPLKREILESAGVAWKRISEVEAITREIETQLAEAADLLVAVSEADADAYRNLSRDCRPLVVRNGADRPGIARRPAYGGQMARGRYLMFVGSAYPPNIEGFTRFVLKNNVYSLPPEKLLAVCGGAADGIFQSGLYAPHNDSYQDRVHFFGRPSDEELMWLRQESRGILLPILTGGGSNLKSAEAIVSGKWVIATPMALRSFEDLAEEPGVLIADQPKAFFDAMLDVIYGEPLRLTATQKARRERLIWDNLLEEVALAARVEALLHAPDTDTRRPKP